MSTVEDFLSSLRRQRVNLWLEGDQLRYRARGADLSAGQMAEIRARKPEIVGFLRDARQAMSLASPPLAPRPRGSVVPLSFAQGRLWLLDQLGFVGSAYNLSSALMLDGDLDVPALQRSFDEVVRRHESLRTHFDVAGGEPVQVIDAPGGVRLEYVDLAGPGGPAPEAEARRLTQEDAERPFDLAAGPLLRAKLLRLGIRRHVLAVNMHHIISDGWSTEILIREVGAIYAAYARAEPSPLGELPIQYADYALWQREWLRGEVLQRQLTYWKTRLSAAPAALELPTDRARAPVQSFRGRSLPFTLPSQLSASLAELGRRAGATLHMTLLAAFSLLLSRYTGREDIIVGSPIAGRPWRELEGVVGFFVNMLVLRTDLSGDLSFLELLDRVKETTLEAHAHQDLPFERLVEELHPVRDLSRQPVFQVVLAVQNIPQERFSLPGLELTRIGSPRMMAKFDLSLHVFESPSPLRGLFEYATDLFDHSTIERLARHFEALLENVVATPHARLSSFPMLGEAERRQLLVDWNLTAAAYPRDATLHRLFSEAAARTPSAKAIVFEEHSLTYAQLERHSNQLAHRLQALGVGPEVVVGLCVERSIAMVTGLLGILKAGGAYLPLDPAHPRDRLLSMLSDAGAPVLVTLASTAERLAGRDVRVVLLDEHEGELLKQPDTCPDSGAGPDNLAYVLYTSGSTGKPKGVLVEHHRVVNYIWALRDRLGFEAVSSYLLLQPITVDSTVSLLYAALLFGGVLHIVTYETSVNAEQLAAYVARHDIDCLKIAPPHLQSLLASPGHGATLLPRKVLIVGGDVSPWEWIDRLVKLTPPTCRAFNHYGPTEATVGVTTYAIDGRGERGASGAVPIGRSLSNAQVFVLDVHLEPVAIGIVGEVYLGGVPVVRGYLGRPGLTAERFVPSPFGSGERLYRTGDRARRLADGNIEFLGRADDQVKIRGYRIELDEIANALLEHTSVRQAVVVANGERGQEKSLVAYAVLTGEPAATPADLRTFLAAKLPGHMVPADVIVLDALPRTPHGKLDRRALPAPDSSQRRADYVAPRTATEQRLVDIWAQVLKREPIGIHADFFELGGHSLLATQVILKIRAAFRVSLPIRALFEAASVASLAQRIEAAQQDQPGVTLPPIVRVERTPEGLPLSFAQQRLWFLDQLEPGSAFYNVPTAVRLTGQLDVGAMTRAVNEIVRRHESLRTTFATVDRKPVQMIAAQLEVTAPLTDLTRLPPTAREARARSLIEEEARTPFDLATGPLIRAGLIRLAQTEHILFVTLHHITSDGWSTGILVREFASLYTAFVGGLPSPLPELPIQYADFSHWQRQWLTGEVLEQQLAYWIRKLQGAATLLALPADRPRPAAQSHRGGALSSYVAAATTAGLHALSRSAQTTLFMTLAATFSVLMSRYSRQTDICIGTAIANRNRAEIEPLIGFFVNTLVIRAHVDGGARFMDLLQQIRSTALEAYGHQDVPFEQLVDALNPQRAVSHAPLVQVTLVLQNAPMEGLELPGLTLEPASAHSQTAKLDLSVNFTERDGQLFGAIEYNSDLFDATTIERMLRHFTVLLEGVVADPNARVRNLPMLEAEERARVLQSWNSTEVGAVGPQTLQQLFEAQVARTPDHVAVMFEGARLSYVDLNARANQLAHRLRGLGVGADVLVGVCVERSLDMLVAILGVLKAGGAYVPLDPSHPTERLAYMIEDAQVLVLITQSHLADSLPQVLFPVLIDAEWPASERSDNPDNVTPPESLAYVIYTSGTTGKPKGVMLTHRGLCNLARAQVALFGVEAGQRVLQFASVNFDASASEIVMALTSGATLCLAPRESLMPGLTLEATLERLSVNVATLPPVAVSALTGEMPSTLHTLVVAGEACSRTLVEQWAGRHRFFNAYGPTEATVCASAHHCQLAEPGVPPIGRPIANTQIYILDHELDPVPSGVIGELYIAGVGLGRGYLGRPDLTADAFIPNPFGGEPGSRMYRSGDLARYRRDGTIEYVGRLDDQVKVRGYRIEPAEIEAVLAALPGVQDAVVLMREDVPGEGRLAAYVVADLRDQANDPEWGREHTAHWRQTFDQMLGAGAGVEDAQFDIRGWRSSYDGTPLAREEMQEWVDQTVARILATRPGAVLELGCGTGLLLHRIAPHCRRYYGTDISGVTLDTLRRATRGDPGPPCDIRLFELAADDFSAIPAGGFDTVIANSVAQYFPSLDYLTRVLDRCIQRIDHSGSVFIGDVRHFGLLEVFLTALAMHAAPATAPLTEVRRAVAQRRGTETELSVDPGYFVSLREKFPRIRRIEILPKLGRAENELTKFRFDVLLSIGEAATGLFSPRWRGWDEFPDGVSDLERLFATQPPECLGVRAIPDARTEEECLAYARTTEGEPGRTVADLKDQIRSVRRRGVSPNALVELAGKHGYVAQFAMSAGASGAFHVVFSLHPLAIDWSDVYREVVQGEDEKLWSNHPVFSRQQSAIRKRVVEHLRRQLPAYMIPSFCVVLDRLPVTLSGKVDREALPAPQVTEDNAAHVAPRGPVEERVAGIWSSVLGLDQVSVHDNFFDLGGHSLLATQMASSLRDAFHVELPLRAVFESPTVAKLSVIIESLVLRAIEALSEDEANQLARP